MVILLSTFQFIHINGWPENDILSENTISANFIASQSNKSSYLNRSSSSGHDHTYGDDGGAAGRYGKGRVERFAETNWDHPPSSWCILTPEQSTSRQTEVLASYNESLISIDQLDVQDQVSFVARYICRTGHSVAHSTEQLCMLASFAALFKRSFHTHYSFPFRPFHSFCDTLEQSICSLSKLQ